MEIQSKDTLIQIGLHQNVHCGRSATIMAIDRKMKNRSTPTLIVLAGPTAVGKTYLAIRLAKAMDTLIVSCDSRQFYREMNIGTAKPTDRELAEVPHFFINSHAVKEAYSVGKFEKEVLAFLALKFKEKQSIVMTGGSGLYIKAVCDGLDEFPDTDKSIRRKIEKEYRKYGINYLQETTPNNTIRSILSS